MDNKLNECILVAGTQDEKYFLAKNRDRKFIAEYKVHHTLYKGIEVVYAEDSTGWLEGMNEYGVGFIYVYLMFKNQNYYKWTSRWGIQPQPALANHKEKSKTDLGNQKRDEFKEILLCRTAEDAVEHVKTMKWNGSYFVGDKKGIYEIEHFDYETNVKRCDFKSVNFKVKTNFGNIMKYAGHVDGYQNTARGNAEVRRTETQRYLLGFKNYTDVLRRMQQQTFTNDSSLNVFRTDDEEITVSQILMDLNNRIFHFIQYDENSTFHGLVEDLPKDYESKIHVFVRNKDEFNRYGEWKQFLQKKNDLYYHYKDFKVDF